MSREREQRLWDRMRSALGAQDGLRLERIENVAGTGIPDVLSCRCGRVVFTELKVADHKPARVDTQLLGAKGLRRDQRNWHLSWQQHGGQSFIVIAVDDDPTHFAVDGRRADEVNAASMMELAMMAAVVGRGPSFWKMFGELL